MSYTPAQMDAAVAALVRQIHGIHPDVARAWATAEQGVNYNILGVTYIGTDGKQHLYKYNSWDAGAAGAYSLIIHGPYGGIRVALASGTSQQQAAAIIASPWNHPYYSTGAGAKGLRDIASSVSTNDTLYNVLVKGATPVYSSSTSGIRIGTVYSATLTCKRYLIGGHWWYNIIAGRIYVGKWMPAESTMTVTVK